MNTVLGPGKLMREGALHGKYKGVSLYSFGSVATGLILVPTDTWG